MNDKIIIVTAPDDILIDGTRILAYGLDSLQSKILSDALKELSNSTVIVYTDNGKENSDWVLDKKQKCSILIVNAETYNQTMVGYLLAQPNSYYFGELMDINKANTNKLYSKEAVVQIMEEETTKYARI